jgi:LAO/AO transport system kinase
MNKASSHKSALKVMGGIEQPSQINDELVCKLKIRKSKNLSSKEYVDGIISGNRTLLSQAITLIESALPSHQQKAQEIIAGCLRSPASSSIRIGITGVPGAGKSTFIEALGKNLTTKGYKLAVLAIDPSSSRSKGSILGDKTRMEELAVDPSAFIRPSPSAGSLGGVARKTRETIILCEAAGFDVIFVETVGVGQSEIAVYGMVDFFLLLLLAGAGDELQGIKRGIIEMADLLVINKADGDNTRKAMLAKTEYSNALHLFPPSDSGWIPMVGTCSSLTREGVPDIWDQVQEYRKFTEGNGYFYKKRMEQNRQVFYDTIESSLKSNFFSQKGITLKLKKMESEIISGKLNPYIAAQQVLDTYFHADEK